MTQIVVRVQYGRVTPPAPGDYCFRCGGIPQLTRNCTKCQGWSYFADIELGLKVGDIVIVPPTPRKPDHELEATVISIGATHVEPAKAVIRKVEDESDPVDDPPRDFPPFDFAAIRSVGAMCIWESWHWRWDGNRWVKSALTRRAQGQTTDSPAQTNPPGRAGQQENTEQRSTQ